MPNKVELNRLAFSAMESWTIPDSYRVKQITMLVKALLTDAYNEIATTGWLEKVREAGGIGAWADAKIKEMDYVPDSSQCRETKTRG